MSTPLMQTVADRIGRPVPVLRVVGPEERRASPVVRTARPEALDSFIGQSNVVFNLTVECRAASKRGELPDHILLEGPAGLGKSSLAACIADVLGKRLVVIPATSMGTVREAAAAIASIGGPDEGPAVVWSDETHAACKKGQQLWLDALENGEFTPPGAKEPFVLAPFVLIGATTNPGQLLRPLLDRFTVRESLDFYSTGEIEKILRRYAGIEGFAFDDAGYAHLAAVGRGTPRIANAILRRVARFGEVADLDAMTGPDVEKALAQLGIDEFGLDPLDRRILKDGLAGQDSPIGIEALADMLCLDSDAVTNREPYLMRTRLIKRLSGGRVLTKHGYHVLRCVDKEFTMPTPPWVGL